MWHPRGASSLSHCEGPCIGTHGIAGPGVRGQKGCYQQGASRMPMWELYACALSCLVTSAMRADSCSPRTQGKRRKPRPLAPSASAAGCAPSAASSKSAKCLPCFGGATRRSGGGSGWYRTRVLYLGRRSATRLVAVVRCGMGMSANPQGR